MDIDLLFQYFKFIFPFVIGILAAFLLFVGLRGIISRRPFLISNRWLLNVMIVVFVPIIILFLFLPNSSFSLMKWVNPAIFTVVLVMMFFLLKGFSAYGVSDTSFREALITSLDKLQLSHEETLSSIRLTSVEADLQVSVQSWMGSGVIKIKQREHKTLLTQIVSEMNIYFRTSSTPSNLTPCIFYLVMGILMLGGGVGIVFLLFNIV